MARDAGASWQQSSGISDTVYQCINATAFEGESTDDCLVKYYLGQERGLKLEDYFVYEMIPTENPVHRETMYIDACQVIFSLVRLKPG